MVAIMLEHVEEDYDEYPKQEYTFEQIWEFLEVIFSPEILLALKFLRGSSGLDRSVVEPLKNPNTYRIVMNGIEWINQNYQDIPFTFDFDPDGEDNDYEPSDSEYDTDEDEIVIENALWEDWDWEEWDDEPEYVDL